jgi:CheY-like chemotaxis protein
MQPSPYAQAVPDPRSRLYRHYLSPAQAQQRFGVAAGQPVKSAGMKTGRARRGGRMENCGVHPIAADPIGRKDRPMADRILIVDDSPHFRAAATVLLAERGFEVLLAADGDQALAAAAEACPDGILLDINLPGPDGFAVAASLAAACPRARIVLTSAGVTHVSAQALKTSTAVGFVPKQELAVTDLRTMFAG